MRMTILGFSPYLLYESLKGAFEASEEENSYVDRPPNHALSKWILSRQALFIIISNLLVLSFYAPQVCNFIASRMCIILIHRSIQF
jgi:hypothetical protein